MLRTTVVIRFLTLTFVVAGITIPGCERTESDRELLSHEEDTAPDVSLSDGFLDTFSSTDSAVPELQTSPGCEHYGQPSPLSPLPDGLQEVSGLAMSRIPGILWMHNDSGSGPRLYAVQVSSGSLLATVTLPLEYAYDWEDMSAGPCQPASTQRCLYVGDIGDGGLREFLGVPLQIHRIAEPDPLGGDQEPNGVETMIFRYPDGVAHNAEAMVVDDLARVFVLTKEEGSLFWLFGAPYTPGETAVELFSYGAFDVSSMHDNEPTKVTAADYDPLRNRLLVRGWLGILEYVLPQDRDLTALAGVEPRVVPCSDEAQGEAVTFGDTGYYQVSEGANQTVWFIPCADP